MRRFSRALSVIGVAALISAVLPTTVAFATTSNKPSAPRQVVVSNLTSVSADLAWAEPTSNGGSPITDYTVSYRKWGEEPWSVVAHTPSAATSRTVTGLQNTTRYEFRIAAVNTNGTGPWSTSLTKLWLFANGSCGLTSAGPFGCWGFSGYGDGGTTVQVLAELDGSTREKTLVSLAPRGSGACAILGDGSTVCWGENYSGQLGNGTLRGGDVWDPVQVTGFDGTAPASTALSISSEAATTCTIMANGSAWCWGEGGWGNLGNGELGLGLVPAQVIGLNGSTPATTPVQISVGTLGACAVLANASAVCWGGNNWGQIGDGTTERRLTPTPVFGLDGSTLASSVLSISSSGAHTCALLGDKSVKCWGGNRDAQLGDGTTTPRSSPTPVVGLDGSTPASSVDAITTNGEFSCALLADKSTKCWGTLVLNFTQALLTPTAILLLDGTSPGKTVVEFASGAEHTCAIIADGSTRCWGRNDYDQVGDGSDEPRPEPVQPLDAAGIFATTAAPLGATSRVTTSRASSTSMLLSWSAPVETGGFPITNYRMRYRKSGVAAWGEFAHPDSAARSITVTGLLPGTSYEFQVAAVTVVGTGPRQPSFVDVSVGSASSCAVTSDGRAECWGADSYGALGNGAGDASRTPVPVVGIDGSDDASTAVSIGSGDDYSCAVMKDESVACWGQNQDGQLGNGSTVDSARPVRVLGLNSDSPATSIGISASHACTVVDGGSENARCWGKNDRGQLGDGGTSNQSTPIEVFDGGGYFTGVTTGRSSSCAAEFGYVNCWGLNDVGQLGDGTTTNAPQGVYVPVFDYSSDDTGSETVASAGSTVCALSYAGTVRCWGYGLQGGLGNGATRNSSVPVRVTGIDGLTPGTTAKDVASGGASQCAVMESGAVKCWGANAQGQLGNNSTVNSAIPVAVTGLDGSTPAKSATSVAVSEAGSACATLVNGGVACWGDNSSGQLGDGTVIDRRTPVNVARAAGTTLVEALPAAAPGAPQNLAVSVRLAETIGLDWDAPASNGGARITSYEVRWARGDQQPAASNLLEISGDQVSTRVAGLVPGVSYTFFVKAVNSVGTGPTARVTAIVPVEPEAPVVTKTAWSNRKITLTWLAVKTPAHSPIVDYVLTCEVTDVFFRQTVSANARFASVTVDSDKRAACRVAARTDAGRGPGSDRVIVSLKNQG